MPRDSKLYLEDIVAAADRVAAYVSGLTRESLERDPKTIDAVVRNLEIIGEAVKQLPVEVREAAPSIEWPKIAGLRDVLIHAYFNVDLDILWDIVTNKVPGLAHKVRQLLERGRP